MSRIFECPECHMAYTHTGIRQHWLEYHCQPKERNTLNGVTASAHSREHGKLKNDDH